MPMRLINLPLFSVIISVACCFEETAAQGYSTKAEIDSMSYQQFIKNDICGLRATLKKAESSEVDFFYLRLRAALLFTRLGRHEWSYPQAHRLMQMNPYDTLAQRLWLLALRYTGRRTEELRWLSTCDSVSYRRLIGADPMRSGSGIQWETASVGLGHLTEEAFKARRDGNFLESGALYSERTLQGPMTMLGVAVEARLGKVTSRNKAYRWKTSQSLGVFQSHPQGAWEALNQDPVLGIQRYTRSYEIRALQYHGLLEHSPSQARNWSTGLIWGTFSENSKHLSSILLPDFSGLAPVDCLYSHQSLLATLYGRYRRSSAEFMASVGYANLAKQPHVQIDGGLTWYPGGRSSMYYTGSWSGLLPIQTDAAPVRHIVAHKLGSSVYKKWWGEVEYISGIQASGPTGARGLSNYTRPLTFQTFNTVEPILSMAGLGLIRYHRYGALRLGYQRQIRETTFYNILQVAGSTTETTLELKPQKHTLHLIHVALTWKLHSST